jgi:DNA sulfur modification protein DndB
MDTSFGYSFPAIRGVQAGREYYVSMCPLRIIPRIFLFDEEELVPELRAQRVLNKARIPEMARYMTHNKAGYIFSALTASIDGKVSFEAIPTTHDADRIGVLHVHMDSRFIINDGQHRRAAIEIAIREKPDLADESIAVVFFLDIGLERAQQMFADLNRYAIRPARSLSVLYDHRDDGARLTKLVVLQCPVFDGLVEMEKSTLSLRSRKLFTLSALYHANGSLLYRMKDTPFEELVSLATDYWTAVAEHIPEWRLVREQKMPASEVRQNFIHSHGIALQALGNVGQLIVAMPKERWKSKLKAIADVDWSRSNTDQWEGRALIGGRVSKATNNVTLVTNTLKQAMRLPLSPEEQRIEEAFTRGDL